MSLMGIPQQQPGNIFQSLMSGFMEMKPKEKLTLLGGLMSLPSVMQYGMGPTMGNSPFSGYKPF
jgi:hypothetical protein